MINDESVGNLAPTVRSQSLIKLFVLFFLFFFLSFRKGLYCQNKQYYHESKLLEKRIFTLTEINEFIFN